MSPEQIQGKPLTGASDIFSLGVVLTELASGHHPFLQETAALTSWAIQTSEPAWLSSNEFKIAEPLGSLLRSMLAKELERRPSAAMVAARLASIAREPAAGAWRRWTVPAMAALAVCLAMAVWIWRDKATPVRAPRITPFTAYEGLERNPSFSPNGNQIAFSWNGPDQKNWDIYVKAIGEDVPRRLTTNPAEDFNPIWSPDGQQIAFLRRTSHTSMPLIVIVPAAGGPEREVTRLTAFFMNITHPIAWWPDGKSLVYRKPLRPRTTGSLYRRFVDTGEEKPLAYEDDPGTDSQPTAVDENRLAVIRNLNSARSAVCLAVRGGKTECLPPGELIDGLVLQPDGKSLLYAAESAIWRVAVRGNHLGRANRVLDGSFPDLTGDRQGKRLAFTRAYTDLNIWKITLGSRKVEKLISSSAEEADADYSPDGERIAFTSNRSGHSELYTCQKDGSGVRQLTSLRGDVGSPVWSPDGRSIAFDAVTEDTRWANVYIVSAAGGAPRHLTNGDQGAAIFPLWSSDGRWIYYSIGRISFWKIPWDGGTAVQVSNFGGKADPRLSGDGRSVYYMGQVFEGGVHRLDLASSNHTIVAGTERAMYRNWALAGGGIYFVEDTAPTLLRFLDFRTNRVKTAANLPGKPNTRKRGLAISPDGSSLLYTSVDNEIGDIMLIEGIR
jgi:Tol biopolymer transport system component